MAKDYLRLWRDITNASDEGEAIRTLAEILVDREGRTFITNLKRGDAELCIEILDYVSLSLIRPIHSPLSPTQISFLLGHRRAQPKIGRETSFLPHFEKTRRNSWTLTGVDGDNGKN